jgi:hypothetical protein
LALSHDVWTPVILHGDLTFANVLV